MSNKQQSTDMSNMPKWNKDNYSNWREWAIHCYKTGREECDIIKAENEQLKEQVKELLTTLEKIKMWEMPESRIYLDKEKTKQLSYGAAYGSNGERDYIKSLAVKAINKVAAK